MIKDILVEISLSLYKIILSLYNLYRDNQELVHHIKVHLQMMESPMGVVPANT